MTTDTQFDRLPPHDIEAEKSVIGALMLAGDDGDIVSQIREHLRTESFYQPDLGIVFDAICRLHQSNTPIDSVTVRAELLRAGLFDEVGGVDFMSQIITTVPAASAGPYYAKIVREKFILREVIRAANKAITKAYAPSRFDRAAEIAREFLNDLTAVAYTGSNCKIHHISEVLMEVVEEYDRKARKRSPTGLYELDDMIGGVPVGKFTLIGGRPRIGKSQLCKQIVLNMTRSGVVCGIVTIEEDRLKIGQNYLSNASGIQNNRISYGTADEVEWGEILKSMPGLSHLPLYVADEPICMSEVQAAIRTMVQKHKCEVIVVDYLQLIDAEEDSNEYREISKISKVLKQTFKRLGVAGIAACQLNRGNETGGVRKPTMRDLRGSGSLEQDGDVIILLHREDVYHQGEAGYPKTNQMEAIVVKNKDGEAGIVPLWFNGETQTIADWDKRPGADPFAKPPAHFRPPVANDDFDGFDHG